MVAKAQGAKAVLARETVGFKTPWTRCEENFETGALMMIEEKRTLVVLTGDSRVLAPSELFNSSTSFIRKLARNVL